MRNFILTVAVIATSFVSTDFVRAQSAPAADATALQGGLARLNSEIDALKVSNTSSRDVADVEVFAKGVEWCLRHGEFYANSKKPDVPSAWFKYSETAIEIGSQRAADLKAGQRPWAVEVGSTIRGYVSRVDGSTQPYALSLPEGFNEAKSGIHIAGGTFDAFLPSRCIIETPQMHPGNSNQTFPTVEVH